MPTQMQVVEVTCVSCKTKHTIMVPAANYRLWASGQAKIQHALPMLSEDERGLLMSNICPVCWDKLFS